MCVSLSVSEDCQEQLDFKDMKLQMLLVSLKELTATKEVIQTLEQLLCEESSQLQEERRQVSSSSKLQIYFPFNIKLTIQTNSLINMIFLKD